jgi:hypothetical protein
VTNIREYEERSLKKHNELMAKYTVVTKQTASLTAQVLVLMVNGRVCVLHFLYLTLIRRSGDSLSTPLILTPHPLHLTIHHATA